MTEKYSTTGEQHRPGLTRRHFLTTAGAAGVVIGVSGGLSIKGNRKAVKAAEAQASTKQESVARKPIQKIISLRVNKQAYTLTIDTRDTLAEVIRDKVGLTGTKIGCNHSQCGACTVIMNGIPVYSCSTLAVQADGAEIITIESLKPDGEKLHPIQDSFLKHDALQCGFCTSGQIMTLWSFLMKAEGKVTAEDMKQALAGNLCRCGVYIQIIKAGMEAATAMNKA